METDSKKKKKKGKMCRMLVIGAMECRGRCGVSLLYKEVLTEKVTLY